MMHSSFFAASEVKPSMNSLVDLRAQGRRFLKEGSSILEDISMKKASTNVAPPSSSSSIKVVSKPKRPLTAYNLFFRDSQEQITAMNLPPSQKKKINVAKMISDSWKKATPSVRVYYHELAAKDKFRYYNEKNEYGIYQNHLRKQASKKESSTPPSPTTCPDLVIPPSFTAPQHGHVACPQLSITTAVVPIPHAGQLQRNCMPTTVYDPEFVEGPYCSKRAIADLASQLDDASIDFLIRVFK